MNKRQRKKQGVRLATIAPEITVQQAFNTIAEYLKSRNQTLCYFIDEVNGGIDLHDAGRRLSIVQGGNFHPGGEI